MCTRPVRGSTSTQQQCVACDQPPSGMAKSYSASMPGVDVRREQRGVPVRDRGDVGERARGGGHAAHRHDAVDELDVVLGRLEEMRGEAHHLTPHVGGDADHRAARERGGAAPARAHEVERRQLRVAADDADRVERHAELVGRELRQRGVVTLTVG